MRNTLLPTYPATPVGALPTGPGEMDTASSMTPSLVARAPFHARFCYLAQQDDETQDSTKHMHAWHNRRGQGNGDGSTVTSTAAWLKPVRIIADFRSSQKTHKPNKVQAPGEPDAPRASAAPARGH